MCIRDSLKVVCEPVAEVNDDIRKIVDDMFDTMYQEEGDVYKRQVKYERALKKVGIDNVDILRQIGAENAIVRLKKADIGATEAFYWRLRGALENRNCEFYTEKEKERGLIKLNEILSANGFRRCKRTLKKAE